LIAVLATHTRSLLNAILLGGAQQKKDTWAGLLAAAESERDTAFYKLTQRDASMMELYARYQACSRELDAIKSNNSGSSSGCTSTVSVGGTRLHAVSATVAENQQVFYTIVNMHIHSVVDANLSAHASAAITAYFCSIRNLSSMSATTWFMYTSTHTL
jgi:hypothetical protein